MAKKKSVKTEEVIAPVLTVEVPAVELQEVKEVQEVVKPVETPVELTAIEEVIVPDETLTKVNEVVIIKAEEEEEEEEEPVSIHENELPSLIELEVIRQESEISQENAETKEVASPEVWDEESHEKFSRLANAGAYEIRFKGGLVYDSVASTAVVAFYPAYLRIGHRRFRYDMVQIIRK